MNGLIISGHGSFATGLQSSVKLIVGDQPNVEYVDFLECDSTCDLEKKLLAAFSRLQKCESILVLCDLVGGSPFKTAVSLTNGKEGFAVVGGTNLAMVIETILLKDGLQTDGLRDLAINTGKEAIKGFQKSERPRCKESSI
ncbi:PTS sugar transporter subunit IIA [Bacillus cereus group sp. N11]|uniref:PTS galactosamine/N-acetylgalactosamine transporter subunit IIA n=1 Tax=Bacillus cereus group sp. N11 TaxID=2794585 RepID=UPI0018F530DD|nr:PTS galactosamine/N-acetylgalactosamine transporter subunit IIA [Bacillus cereus group sp. N11]MBJ8101977.1 PTS sugar transporter subunit IIA [Bacillus cereus group sp. N11]